MDGAAEESKKTKRDALPRGGGEQMRAGDWWRAQPGLL